MIYESNEVKKKNGFEYKEQRMAIDTIASDNIWLSDPVISKIKIIPVKGALTMAEKKRKINGKVR